MLLWLLLSLFYLVLSRDMPLHQFEPFKIDYKLLQHRAIYYLLLTYLRSFCVVHARTKFRAKEQHSEILADFFIVIFKIHFRYYWFQVNIERDDHLIDFLFK